MDALCAQATDVAAVKALADAHRAELGFVRQAALQEAAEKGHLLVVRTRRKDMPIAGFAHFRPCRDGHATLYEIAVAPEARGEGVGRALVEAVEEQAQRAGCHLLRLKCPVDLAANGFYARLGFTRVRLEEGKQRALAVWERRIQPIQGADGSCRPTQGFCPTFYLTLTHGAGETRRVLRLWDESGDPRNPFSHLIFTPLFSTPAGIALIRRLKDERGSVVMFDSGGYQVQMGKTSYEQLFDRLLRFYRENDWADWYVLPDHVPRSGDSPREVEFKVRETLDFARLFLQFLPEGFAARAVGVVHGRTGEQMRRCVEAYAAMGVRYLGFGSFGTSGPNGTVNMVSRKSLELLRRLQGMTQQHGLRLHIFGIGSPSHLIRLADAGLTPTSFDSAGWWKAGGFGKVFFPGGRQLHITQVDGYAATYRGIQVEQQRTQHECSFCTDLPHLRRGRMARIMHNLAAMLDTAERAGEP